MSEQILNALMQLFAIVANVDEEIVTSRSFVRIFLAEELDANQTEKYLHVYDDFIQQHNFRKRAKDGAIKRTSRNSVKMLRIAAEINRSLTKPQKQVALLRLVEYVYSRKISTQENREFIDVIADAFNIESNAFQGIMEFVCFHEKDSKHTSLLEVSSTASNTNIKHLKRHGISGKLIFIYLSGSGLVAFKKTGNSEFFVSGVPLKDQRIYLMKKGSSIKGLIASPIYYSNIIMCFTQDSITVPISLQVNNATYKFSNGNVGIQPISFNANSGELTGVMGGSGTGKSTLLSILNGSNEPSTGQVKINGFDLYSEKNLLNGLIGFVPQDDLLMEDLSVWQNLFYSAKLSFGSLTHEAIKQRVYKVLLELGLNEIRHLKVGSPLDKSISGGQRKRLNIALELIREPSILYVDEPTSGLSSRDSEKIMDLLKGLTLKGCIVFTVIHQPSVEIFRQFDQLLVLDTGGYLVFQGNPIDGINYFRKASDQVQASDDAFIENAEQIFDILEAPIVDEFGEYTAERKWKPKNWYDQFNKERKPVQLNSKTRVIPEIDFKIPSYFAQLKVFIKRDVLAKLANTQYLAINLLEMPVLAFIIAVFLRYYGQEEYVFRGNTNLLAYIFISIIVALFIGLSVSAEEIIKDLAIRRRESFLNLSWGGYLNSKIVILFTLSAVQVWLYVIVGNTILGIKGMYFSYWLVLFTAAALANITGLIISASFDKVVTIYILIPFLIIPQIMFSGLLVKYEKLNPWFSSQKVVPVIGDMMVSRWLFESLAVHQSLNNQFDQHFFEANVRLSEANFRKNYWIPEMESALLVLESQYGRVLDEKGFKKLKLLVNEIKKLPEKEVQHLKLELVNFEKGSYTRLELTNIKEFLNLIESYYSRNLIWALNKKDLAFKEVESNIPAGMTLEEFRNAYQNEQLNDYLNNKKDLIKVIVSKNEIINKENQTFQLPRGVNSHYYAPMKLFVNRYYPTLSFNLAVMWVTIMVLGICLYFNVLPRLLNWRKNTSN